VRRLLSIALVVAVVAAGAVGYLGFLRRPAGGASVTVEVASGETTAQIAAQLSADGVIGNALWFRVLAKLRGVDGHIQAGRYQLRKGMGAQAALDVLRGAAGEAGVEVTVPEGFTLRQIAARLEARTQISAAAFFAAGTNGSVRAEIEPPDVTALEGLLFPQTYQVTKRDTATTVARRMVDEFTKATSSLDWSYALGKRLTRYQAVIMASLIEREAKVPEDRAKVAAVIYNRLARHMRLQIDATALYGLPEHKVPTLADLRRPSPYNTYLIPGLPPRPIANPGLASLQAAVHPASIDALYYVVCAPSGRHCFTRSPAEIERLKRFRPSETH
jgi:UPF0755 protein